MGADKAYGAVSAPIYTAAIYRYEAFGKNRGFDYSRGENPTRQATENALAEIEGGAGAVAFSSGMAAVSALMTLFRSGRPHPLFRRPVRRHVPAVRAAPAPLRPFLRLR